MKKANIFVEHENKRLVMSKAFYKKACAFGSKEYVELRNAMNDCDGYSIEFKVSDKETYGGLTFARMAEYIQTQPDADARMVEFEAVKKIAKAKGAKYPLTKKWFLLTYPLYVENVVSDAEKALVEAEKKIALLSDAQADENLANVANF